MFSRILTLVQDYVPVRFEREGGGVRKVRDRSVGS